MLRSKLCDIFRTGRPTNFKLGTQIDHEDPITINCAMTSEVKVQGRKVTYSPSDRGWAISRERKVPETPKLVGRLTTSRAITSTRFEVKGQGHQAD